MRSRSQMLGTCLVLSISSACLAAADVELIPVAGTGMESPIASSQNAATNYLFHNSGGALPNEDGTVTTGGILEEPLFEQRQISVLWQPDGAGSTGTLGTVILEDGPAPGITDSTIQEPGGVYHYSPASGFLLYSFAQNTNTLQYTTVIWNKPDLASNLVPLYQSGDPAPGVPGATLKYPAPALLTANRDGSYAFTASLNGVADSSQAFAAWAVIGGTPQLVQQNNNTNFEAGVLGFSAPVIGGQAVLFQGNFKISTVSFKAYVKWEGGHQQFISREYGTLLLEGTNQVPTRYLGGKAIDDNGRVLFHHQTNTVQESLIREDENGLFHRLVSKDDVLEDMTIVSFADNGSSVTRPLLTPDGRAVFLARFRRPADVFDQVGIWRETAGGSNQFEQLVDGSKPGQLIDFGQFTSLSTGAFDVDDPIVGPDGRIAFLASFGNSNTIDTNDATTAGFHALFAEDSAGVIHMVARTGQAIDHLGGSKIITELFLAGQGKDSNNRVGFNATLVTTNGAFGDVSLVAKFGNVEPPIDLKIRKEGGDVVVTWNGSGVLERALSPTGPWEEVIGAASPYYETPNDERYYRVRRDQGL